MDDNNSDTPSASNATGRLESFHPKCTDLKQQYDQCFNTWFTEHYMNGHYNNNQCLNILQTYTDCVKVCVIYLHIFFNFNNVYKLYLYKI